MFGIFSAAIAAVVSQADPPPASDQRLFTASGYVSDGDLDEGVFTLVGPELRFRLPREERETYWALLVAAAERGVALRVRFDAQAGALDPEGTHVVYPLCSIGSPTGAAFGDETRNCPASAGARPGAERLLALGLAQVEEQPAVARATLTRALTASPALPPRARVIALRGRAMAAEGQADGLEPGSAGYDEAMVAALADHRRRAELMPDSAGARIGMAQALVMLGAYSEAEAVYQEVGERWPQLAFDVAVGRGALLRQRGDHEGALRKLDDFRAGAPDEALGMRFHYHRAWTLMLLGRDEEAVREVTAGMATQADYSSAYELRACVRARLGRIDEALSDQRRSLQLLREMTAQQTPWLRRMIAQNERALAALEQAAASGADVSPSFDCLGAWDRWSRPRQRSSLLEAGIAAPESGHHR